MNVIKRDGTIVPFEFKKIKDAVNKAFQAVYQSDAPEDFINYLEATSSTFEGDMSVEDIQKFVIYSLGEFKFYDVQIAYTEYRYKHNIYRKNDEHLLEQIREKLEATNVENQNANLDERSFGGRIGEASRVVTKDYALNYCMSEMARNNHLNNEIYIHDLDSYAVGMHNCLSIPFDDLLANGFNTRQTDVRPAGSVNTAFQLVAVIFQLQSLQQFGGVSATHIDGTMVPYVRLSFHKHFRNGLKYVEKCGDQSLEKEKIKEISILADYYTKHQEVFTYAIDMTQKEIHQAVEALYHNLNTLQSRSGNQLPFTSINYGTCSLEEGRMVTKALLEVSIEGLGKLHKTPIFPCGIFQCMQGVNRKEGDPNYDLYKLALKSTSRRLYPNYANVDGSGNAGYDPTDPCTYFSTMGCRTTNGVDINAEPGQNSQRKDGRGNIAPVTIIMPTLAMQSKTLGMNSQEDVERFMNLLDKKIHEAKDMLIERFDGICKQSPDSAKFMYENHTMLGYHPEEGIKSALKHGTLVIGQLGLAETLQLLIGKDHTTEEGMALAKRIEQLFKTRCAEFKQEYKLNFGVYYTPAENLCYTAMKKFKAKGGVISGVSDRDYFTNSMHVPVGHELTPMEKIDIESQLTGYSNAGCITYVELPSSAKNNIEALEEIVNYAMDKDIPYFAINIPNDSCQNCGYTDEIGESCPMCESKNIQRLRRVTGYLTGHYLTAFNAGKQEEVKDRVKHAN